MFQQYFQVHTKREHLMNCSKIIGIIATKQNKENAIPTFTDSKLHKFAIK